VTWRKAAEGKSARSAGVSAGECTTRSYAGKGAGAPVSGGKFELSSRVRGC